MTRYFLRISDFILFFNQTTAYEIRISDLSSDVCSSDLETWRFRRYESGAVDYLLKPVDPRMLASKAEVFFELGLQKLELARQRDELRRTAITLAGALSKLKAHDDNSPLAIVEFGPDLQLLSWSKGAERMFGWNAPDVVGKRLSELRWMHDEDAEVFATLVDEMLAD